MKRFAAVVALPVIFASLAMFPAGSQTPPQAPGKAPKAAQKERPPENLPWSRFRPASNQPYQPTAAEKQQIQARVDQLGGIIRGLQDRRADDDLLVASSIGGDSWAPVSEKTEIPAKSQNQGADQGEGGSASADREPLEPHPQ